MTLKFLIPKKHDFDLENPLIDEITTTHEHKLSGTKDVKIWKITGYCCRKCGKMLWLDEWQMKQLPRSMKYGCTGKKPFCNFTTESHMFCSRCHDCRYCVMQPKQV